MIQLECTNCKAVLNIDDAFAGGVCRCQYCGTIQTVPSKKAQAVTADASTGGTNGNGESRTLYKRKARIESALSPFNDGLEKLADEIPSSGLASSLVNIPTRRMSQSPESPSGTTQVGTAVAAPPVASRTAQAAQTAKFSDTKTSAYPKKVNVVLVAAGLTIVGLIGVLVWMTMTMHSDTASQPPVVAAKPEAQPLPTQQDQPAQPVLVSPEIVKPEIVTIPVAPQPDFAGVELNGQGIVYIIDRANCSPQFFAEMVKATSKSIETLGTSRQFQVLIANADRTVAAPAEGLQNANTANRQAIEQAFGDVYTGSNNLAATFQKAASASPSAIVFVTATDADPATVEVDKTAIANMKVPVHIFFVGSSGTIGALAEIAGATGGQCSKINLSNLK